MRLSLSTCAAGWLLAGSSCLGLIPAPALAQGNNKSAPSPVAPGDLSKPMFDTTTPVYDSVASLEKAANTIVAEVEGRPITLGQISDAIRALPAAAAQAPFVTLYPNILEQLIRQEVLVVRAQQQGADEDPAIRRRVRAAADQRLAEEYLQSALSKDITETELLARYDRDVAGKPGPEEVRARVILVDQGKTAADLIAEIRGGADFAAVARRASKDTTAASGGDLGFKTLEQLNPQVGAVAFAIAVGQTAPNPVLGSAGWFVVKVEERRQQPAPSFAMVRDRLRQDLMRERVTGFAATAMNGLKIRRYSFTGVEQEPEKPETK